MTYLIKPPRTRGLSQLATAEELRVRLADVHRVKSSHHVEGFGTFRELESVGKDEGTLAVFAVKPIRADGTGTATRYDMRMKRRPSDLHAAIRRMRDDDAAKVAACDAEIEALRKAIGAVRERRAEAVHAAWKRGQEVPLPEVIAMLDA